jgi:hypothetical protein
MRDLPGEPHFIENALARPAATRVNQLQRDRSLQDQIVRTPHFAAITPADPVDHAVPAGKDIARTKRACC